ncbi:MAG: hypothetical protein QOI96_1227, partial [Verrucomicrobiota bacterium]
KFQQVCTLADVAAIADEHLQTAFEPKTLITV